MDAFLQAPPKDFRIVSGIQPTGGLHLGNYLGAIRPWVQLQGALDVYPDSSPSQIMYSVVDLHALTVPKPAEELAQNCFELSSVLLGCGVDPDRCVLFYQSQVPQISQLQWLLSCSTPMGWLSRMTQFKQKREQLESQKNTAGLGLYTYPVLMTADILLWNATHVPAGDDQTQHLELCRSLADTFNYQYKTPDCFRLTQGIHSTATRVMSLVDGTSKMSKSAVSERSRIHLTDSDDDIRRKLTKAKSDVHGSVTYEPEKRPEIANLLQIYATMVDRPVELVAEDFVGQSVLQLKQATAEVLIANLAPIREEVLRLRQDRAFVEAVMRKGGEKAREIAELEWRRICSVAGLPTY